MKKLVTWFKRWRYEASMKRLAKRCGLPYLIPNQYDYCFGQYTDSVDTFKLNNPGLYHRFRTLAVGLYPDHHVRTIGHVSGKYVGVYTQGQKTGYASGSDFAWGDPGTYHDYVLVRVLEIGRD